MIALAILYKDVRRLWPHILLFWVLLAVADLCDPAYSRRLFESEFKVVTLAIVVACGTLIVSLVQQEALPGDGQYWLTRPIPRGSLVAAKAGFVFLAVNCAVFMSHCFTLTALGIPFGDHLPAILWRQVFLTAFLVLPAAALGAVTRGLAQVFLTGSALALLLVALSQTNVGYAVTMPPGAPPYEIVAALLSTAGAAAVLYLQYSRRSTLHSRVTVAIVVALWFFANRSLIYRPAAAATVSVSLDAAPRPIGGSPAPLGSLEIPIRIADIPSGVDLTVESMRGGIGLPDLTQRWMLHSPLAVIHDFSGGHGWLTVYRGQEEFLRQLTTRVNWYGSLKLVLSKRTGTLPLPGVRGLLVPGIGRCNAQDDSGEVTVSCISPMPRTSLAVELANGARHWIVTQSGNGVPRLEPIDFRPLQNFAGPTTFSVTELSGARLVQGDIVGRLDADFFFQGIRLADYFPQHP